MAASSALLSSPPALTLIPKRKPSNFINAHHSFSRSNNPIFGFPSTQISTRTLNSGNSSSAASLKPIRNWKYSAGSGNYLLSEVSTEENLQEVVSTTDDGVSTVISTLLFIAFIGLAILTVGVNFTLILTFLAEFDIWTRSLLLILNALDFSGNLHSRDRFLAEKGER